MRIGYACQAIAVPGSAIKGCLLKNAGEENLLELIGHNLDSLEAIIDYNISSGISLFRISSDLIPFGSGPSALLPWQNIYSDKLIRIGSKINSAGMHVSMHPGQYTVLNSPDKAVVKRAVEDLRYHTGVLDALKLGTEHKIVLHIGGGYGNKREAAGRFISHYKSLDSSAGNRLVIENDDRIFNIGDVLEISKAADIPVVFDNLHNDVNPADREKTDIEWINFCRATWKNSGGTQKIHYSQPNPEKKKGAHSESIDINRFLSFYKGLSETEPDIMLEVKDKNISAIKCINCASNRGIGALENEWARYKYYVLEHSSAVYEDIRRLLKDKAAYPALEMYGLIEAAAKMPVTTGSAVNAAMHVWGYLKNKAAASDKKSFEQLLRRFNSGETDLQSVKRFLLRLAKRHGEAYLLNSYYFYL